MLNEKIENMKKILFWVILFVGYAILSSCEEELGSKELYVYLRPNNDVNITRSYLPDGSMPVSIDKLKFPVKLTRETSEDVRVALEVNQELVEQYNKQHGTNYKSLPKECFSIKNSEVVISAGNIMDTCYVDLNLLNIKSDVYVLPMSISTLSSKDKGVAISSNTSTAFTILNVGKNVFNIDQSTEDLVGEEADRTRWLVSTSDIYNNTTYDASYVKDGDIVSGWRGASYAYSELIVDMGEVKPIKGVKIVTLTGNVEYRNYFANPKLLSIWVSADGEDWLCYGQSGTLNRPASASSPAITNTIKFVYAKPVRYLKLKVEQHYSLSQGAGMAELNFIE